MNNLGKYFKENNGNLIHKWVHYFDIYERHFSRFRNRKMTILEIGVYQGGSLQMWKNYFGPQAEIYGVDSILIARILRKSGYTFLPVPRKTDRSSEV